MSSKDFFGYSDLFDAVDNLLTATGDAWLSWHDASNLAGGSSSLLPTGMISDTFPPCDIQIDKEKDLLISFAVAGYNTDEIDLSYEKDHLILKLDPKERRPLPDYKYLRAGIRHSKNQTKVYVPSSHYDKDTITSKLTSGILTIRIKAKLEEKLKTSSIKIET